MQPRVGTLLGLLIVCTTAHLWAQAKPACSLLTPNEVQFASNRCGDTPRSPSTRDAPSDRLSLPPGSKIFAWNDVIKNSDDRNPKLH